MAHISVICISKKPDRVNDLIAPFVKMRLVDAGYVSAKEEGNRFKELILDEDTAPVGQGWLRNVQFAYSRYPEPWFVPDAVITPDGVCHCAGGSDELGNGHKHDWYKWRDEFAELISNLAPDLYVSVLDCHC